MDNHFGKGLMAGLNATCADSARNVAGFCSDYKRGFVLGFSHRMFEKTGDRPIKRLGSGDSDAPLWPGQRYGDGLLSGESIEYDYPVLYGGLSSRKLIRRGITPV